jgi:hypothetical protein
MRTNSPTHDEIARCAHEIWRSRGNPHGSDQEIWLEAEGQLTSGSPTPEEDAGEPVAGHSHGITTPAPSPADTAAKAEIQKHTARAPQLQHGKNAPKPAPAESGKPLWSKPHSS